MKRIANDMGLAVMILVTTSCTVEDSYGVLGPAYATNPEAELAVTACERLRSLPVGEPLEDLALGEEREAAVRNALMGGVVDRDDLDDSYVALVDAIDTYAKAFEAAESQLEGEVAVPVAVAAQDWRSFHQAISQQRELTDDVLDLLASSDASAEEVSSSPDYVSLAATWAEAQARVNLIAAQVRWSHHRAVEFLATTCGPLPDFVLEEEG